MRTKFYILRVVRNTSESQGFFPYLIQRFNEHAIIFKWTNLQSGVDRNSPLATLCEQSKKGRLPFLQATVCKYAGGAA